MINLITLFLCLVPFGTFFFRNVDLWHGTGHFVQMGILILFSYSFFVKPNHIKILNKPLGAFICWAGLVTGANWISVFASVKHYPIKIFMPFFNLLCIVILYKILVEYLDKVGIDKVLKFLKYSILLLLFYCTIQALHLDQFFRSIDISVARDSLVGTIGNQSHLGAFLAVIQPLFFNKNRQDILSLIMLWLIIILAGSASGLVCGIFVVLFWLFFKSKKLFIVSSIVSFLTMACMFLYNPLYFTSSGRFETWYKVFGIFKNDLITGSGLGSFGAKKIVTAAHWQHLHNEYYQIAIELGMVGLVLVVWGIWDYFRLFRNVKSELTIKLASMFLGFCLLGLFTFNAHLWLISVFGMFSYSAMFAIKNRENFQ